MLSGSIIKLRRVCQGTAPFGPMQLGRYGASGEDLLSKMAQDSFWCISFRISTKRLCHVTAGYSGRLVAEESSDPFCRNRPSDETLFSTV